MLRIVRDGDIKLCFGENLVTFQDGKIFVHGTPILGITDPAEKAKAAAAIKLKKFNDIPESAYTRLGANQNGLWAGWDNEWDNHPAKIAQDEKRAAEKREEAKRREVYLSSRGWGDYSPVSWYGDITRPDADILTECQELLAAGHDVDRRNLTDDEILGSIRKIKKEYADEIAEAEAGKDKAAKLQAELDAMDITIKVIKSGKTQSGEDCGSDYFANVSVSDNKTNEILKFKCRNIFDFGYVVNPDYKITPESEEAGGLADFEKKTGKYFWDDFESGKGWYRVREMTEFERKAYIYLSKRPPIYAGINM